MEINFRTRKDKRIQLLIHGYIRNEENECNLFIPDSIPQIIYQLFPLLLFKFGEFKKDIFTLNDDAMILEGTDGSNGVSCHGYMVYADLGPVLNDIGLSSGVHLWSVENLRSFLCFASIGVTNMKNDQSINEWHNNGNGHHWIDKGRNSFFSGCDEWDTNQIITVRLDCDNGTVNYYKDDSEEECQKDEIEPNQSYYFALMVCILSRYTKYQIVNSPDHLI